MGQRMEGMQAGFNNNMMQNQGMGMDDNADVDMDGGMDSIGAHGSTTFQGSIVQAQGTPGPLTQAQQRETSSKLESIDIAAALGAVDGADKDEVEGTSAMAAISAEPLLSAEAPTAIATLSASDIGNGEASADSATAFVEELADVPLHAKELGLTEAAPAVYNVWAAVEAAEYLLNKLPVPTLAPPRRDRTFA